MFNIRYNEDLQAGRIQHQTPILSGSEGGSQAVTSPATSIVGEAETMPESKKRKAASDIHFDDGGAENDGNTDAEAAGFGLGRIRPVFSPKCPSPKSLTRCYKKRMHFFVRPKTLKSLCTRLTPISANLKEVAAIGFQDWIVIPWKSSAMYMNRFDFNNLKHGSLMYNYKSAKVSLSNFSTHQGTVVGTGTPQVTIQMSGVAFESVLVSSKEIGPWFVGNASVTNNQITACTSYSFNTAVGIFDTMSMINNPSTYYQSYPYRAIQIFRPDGDIQQYDQTQAVDTSNAPNLLVTNLSNYSNFGFAQPPDSAIDVQIKKKWRAGRFERPSVAFRAHTIDISVPNNPFTQEYASGRNIRSVVQPAVAGSQICKEGHIPTFRGAMFSDYGESIAPEEFTTCSNHGVNANRQASVNNTSSSGNPYSINPLSAFSAQDMFSFVPGNGDHQKDLFAFRIITPPNPIDASADPDISICFTVETELEVEYLPIVEHNYTSRQMVGTVNPNTFDSVVESTDVNFFQANGQFIDPIAYTIPNFNAQCSVFAMASTGPRGTDMGYNNYTSGNDFGY